MFYEMVFIFHRNNFVRGAVILKKKLIISLSEGVIFPYLHFRMNYTTNMHVTIFLLITERNTNRLKHSQVHSKDIQSKAVLLYNS